MINVVIPAAGAGVRFHELGRQYPKCILPYKEKPIIVHNLRKLLKIDNLGTIIIVVGHQGSKIVNTVKTYFPDEVNNNKIDFKFYTENNGNSGPLVSIYNGITNTEDSLLVVLSDILLDTDLELQSSFVGCKEVKDFERWCMVKVEEKLVFYDKVEEKPPTNLALSGVYYFNNTKKLVNLMENLFAVHKDDEIQISTVLEMYQEYDPLSAELLSIIDFGTLEEYEDNRLERNSRIFNIVEEMDYKVVKSSRVRRAKIIDEFNWFRSMPTEIQQFLPRIYDDNIKDGFCDETWYSLEKIRSPTLREWYLFLESDVKFWDKVFNKLFEVIDSFYNTNDLGHLFIDELRTKTADRIDKLEPKYRDYEFLVELEKIKIPLHDSIFHGDMTLSNIFFDDKTGSMKLIDPRGTIQGNILYDYAKLMTCIIYDYDFIDAHLYSEIDGKYTFFNSGKQPIKDLFMKKLNGAFSKEVVKTITIIAASLFLTMIPLHSESFTNQKLFYQCYKRALEDATQNSL